MVLYDTAASGPGLAVSCTPTLPRQGLVWRGIFVMSHESERPNAREGKLDTLRNGRDVCTA